MALSMKLSTANNFMGLLIRHGLIMCASLTKLSMASNRPRGLGTAASKHSSPQLVSGLLNVTTRCSSTLMGRMWPTFCCMWMTSYWQLHPTIFCQHIIGSLQQEFAMTDLGNLHYFLGVSAKQSSSGLFLSQAKYAAEILDKANMSSCNPCQTPIEVHSKLSAQDGPPVADPTLYRSLARALQYLTLTRPDIAHAV